MNSPALQQRKAEIRSRIHAALASKPPASMGPDSHEIVRRVLASDLWKNAKAVLLYAPMPGEADVWPLVEAAWRSGKTLALPRFNRGSKGYEVALVASVDRVVASGHFGIREPAPGCPSCPVNRLDLAMVPGLAFDHEGRRLGRGKGYYDQLLASYSGIKCGIAFEEQVVDEIPVEPHDVILDCILTPSRWMCIRFGPRGVCG